MKTTIDIAEPLLRSAKRLAKRRNTTLRAIIEESLRQTLRAEDEVERPVRVRTHTFRGEGLQPGLSWDDWGALRELAYEGRGT
jgi:hypothetical protein